MSSEQAFTEWSQKQIDTLWAERQRLAGENASLRAQLAEAQEQVQTIGLMLTKAETDRDQWKAEALANLGAEQAADELRKKAEAERDKALARMEAYRATCVDYQARAQAAEIGICMPGCETLAAVETERNAALKRAEAAEERASAWQEKAIGETGKQEFDEVVQMCREAQARAEAAESAAGVMREALVRQRDFLKAYLNMVAITGGYGFDPINVKHELESVSAALSHPEAQGGRVEKLEAAAKIANQVWTACGVAVLQAMPQSSIELLQELREALDALDATGKEGI